MNQTRVATVGQLAQVVAEHNVRIGHCEAGLAQIPTAAVAGQAVSIADLGRRMDKQEEKLSSLRTWLIGVLATSLGTLALLLFQQLTK